MRANLKMPLASLGANGFKDVASKWGCFCKGRRTMKRGILRGISSEDDLVPIFLSRTV